MALEYLLDEFFYFFFFQAEDGIRDLYVTGVQTCALPISARELLDDAVERHARRRDRAEPVLLVLDGGHERGGRLLRREPRDARGQEEQIGRASCRERV